MNEHILINMSETIVADGSIVRKPGAFEKRIHEIDFIRGFLIALVLMDHLFCWLWQYNGRWADSAALLGKDNSFYQAISDAFHFYWTSTARHVVRFFALFGFSFVSGVSSAFSRNNWVRAGQMLIIYGAIAVGSRVLDAYFGESVGSSLIIDFNIIGVLAWSTLFYCFTMNKSWRSILIGFLISFLIAGYFVPWLEKINAWKGISVFAPALFDIRPHGDWLPLFPFMAFFFLGAFVSYFVYVPTKKSLIKYKGNWERPFCFMGRHSLLFYACHQLVMIPFFLLLSLFLGK